VQTGTNALGQAIFTFQQNGITLALAAAFFAISAFFVYRSFYGMRIQSVSSADATQQ